MSDFFGWVNKNLPAVLTGGVILLTGVALGTGIRAGYKTKETIDQMPDADSLDKVKACAKYYVIPVAATAGAMACAFGAHKEHTARYMALAGTLAITQKDNKYLQQFKEKAEEKLGFEGTEEVKQNIDKDQSTKVEASLAGKDDAYHWFHDKVTGQVFRRTFKQLIDAKDAYNEDCKVIARPMSWFYQLLLGDEYQMNELDEYEGCDNSCPLIFRYDTELASDMSQVYTISYDHIPIITQEPSPQLFEY